MIWPPHACYLSTLIPNCSPWFSLPQPLDGTLPAESLCNGSSLYKELSSFRCPPSESHCLPTFKSLLTCPWLNKPTLTTLVNTITQYPAQPNTLNPPLFCPTFSSSLTLTTFQHIASFTYLCTMFIVCHPSYSLSFPLFSHRYKTHKGRDVCLFCSLKYLKQLEQSLAHRWPSINTC